MNLFEKLLEVSDSVDLLDSFLENNIQSINDFYNSEYSSVLDSKDSIERFILFKSNIIEQLDYQKRYNRAFVSILLDFCERFNFIAAAPRIFLVIEKNDINFGHRLQAALLFLNNIDCIPTLVGRFDLICQKLQTAIELEEDNNRKAISTFLNYYSIVIRDTQPHIQYALDIKSKIEDSISNNIFSFLDNEVITDVLRIDLNNADLAFEKIQSIIDFLLEKTGFVKPVFASDENTLLIEHDTEYSITLKSSAKDFVSIRKISTNKIKGIPENNKIYNSLGRGVAILESEPQMYSYMNSFGSAHHAKMLSALDKISFNEIGNDTEIFDWSCGQGLASMVLYEHMQSKAISLNIRSVTLIEPSNICLQRAALHVKHFDENCNIKTINKDIDSLAEIDVKSNVTNTKIHFFSNILDVDDFSMIKLIELIECTQKGLNYFVCVSPYITDTKAERVDGFSRYFENKYSSYKLLGENTNGGRFDDEYWSCNNKYKNCMCSTHPHTCKGEKKWTRIIRVFKVVI